MCGSLTTCSNQATAELVVKFHNNSKLYALHYSVIPGMPSAHVVVRLPAKFGTLTLANEEYKDKLCIKSKDLWKLDAVFFLFCDFHVQFLIFHAR